MNIIVKKNAIMTRITELLKNIKIIFPIILISSCQQMSNGKFVDDEGIQIELIENDSTSVHLYNFDNNIYVPEKEFHFQYLYVKNGEKYLYRDDGVNWNFVKHDTLNSKIIDHLIKEVHMTVVQGNPMKKYITDYNQTVIKYNYHPKNSYNLTGLVENSKNIWLHPPRQSMFEILELNPFPFIKTPFKIGNKWNWKLRVGDHWGDPRWWEWEGVITNSINYEIVNFQKVNTAFGNIDCYIVDSYATNEIGKTFLKAYFNEKYGFVKLNYVNIDNSQLFLKLVKID